MTNIVTNFEEVDFKKCAITFFMPDGRVISINKIKGYQFHPDYIKLIIDNYPELEKIASKDILDFYSKNPMLIMIGLWPLYLKEGISMYLNISSYVSEETEEGIILLSENLTEETRKTMKNMDKQLEKVFLLEIGHYFDDLSTYEYVPNEEFGPKTSQNLFDIVDNKKVNPKILNYKKKHK